MANSSTKAKGTGGQEGSPRIGPELTSQYSDSDTGHQRPRLRPGAGRAEADLETQALYLGLPLQKIQIKRGTALFNKRSNIIVSPPREAQLWQASGQSWSMSGQCWSTLADSGPSLTDVG